MGAFNFAVGVIGRDHTHMVLRTAREERRRREPAQRQRGCEQEHDPDDRSTEHPAMLAWLLGSVNPSGQTPCDTCALAPEEDLPMKFYDCKTAPSPRRVRMLIAEKAITVETIQVDLANREHLGAAFRAINPYCTVPVLVLNDGSRLLDSNSISLYLDETFPGPNLSGRDARERAIVQMWQREMDQNGLNAVAECFRNSANGFRDRALTGALDFEQIPALAERGRRRVRQFFSDLDRRLSESTFIALDRFTIADITAFVTVEFTRAIKEPVPEDAHHLRRWREAVRARPSASV